MSLTTFPAMGTDVVAWGLADESGRALREWFEAAEGVFSRFMATSELAALNDSADATVRVSERMAACLAAALDLRTRTEGLVDPAVGTVLAEWGYNQTFIDVLDLDEVPDTGVLGLWSIVDGVVTRAPGTRLDLGGIAKGWTCDSAVEQGLAAVVSAGGDVRSAHPDTVVSITDPWGETAAHVHLGTAALATSSTTRRRWKVGSEDAHHIIDPRTSVPAATPVLSATVTAATAVEAEAGAKAVLLHGAAGLAWAEQQPWISAALVIWQDGNVYATTGWEMAA